MLKTVPVVKFAAVTVKSTLPALVIITVCVVLLVTMTLPKLTLDGLTLSCKTAATPVPCRETTVGLLFASLVMVMLPAAAPAAGGANCAVNVVDAPAVKLNGAVKFVLKPAAPPASVTDETFTVEPPVLVTVNV